MELINVTQLLNISLPFDSTHLSINDAALLSESKILPRIYVNQVLLDTSKDELEKMIATNSLDSLGGAYFGASYAYTLQRIKSSSALLFHLDIMQLWTDLTPSPLTVVLDDPAQKVLELVLLSRPIQSAADASDRYEMVRASLIPRPQVISSTKKGSRKTMWFLDWDAHGKKGTPAHALNIASESFETYVTSGVWALVVFILAIMALFILIFLFCIFACGWGGDDYERAQRGKRGGKTGGGNDVEKARRFLSPEELGLRGSGQVVGVGKSD